MNTLPNDIARCAGKWATRGNESVVKGECKTCLRRTAKPIDEVVTRMLPPAGRKCSQRIANDA